MFPTHNVLLSLLLILQYSKGAYLECIFLCEHSEAPLSSLYQHASGTVYMHVALACNACQCDTS